MNTFNNTTQNKLEKLFSFLPEIFFWTVIIARLFIGLPLFLAAKVHFAFLEYPALIITSALLSVFIVEIVLTLPSLSTAFFKRHGLKRYQRVAFVTTILLGVFNQSLIILAWKDTGMSREAFYVYSTLNLTSIVLAEFIGFMIAKPKTENLVRELETKTEEQQPITEGQIEIKERSITGATNDVATILMLNLSDPEKMLKLNEAGMTQREIAKVLGTNPTKVNTELKRLRSEPEHEE